MNGWVEVYRTPSEDDARAMAELLGENGIAGEVAPGGVDDDGLETSVLRVEPAAEQEAVRLISEQLEGRGHRPEEGAAESTGGARCPNCAQPVPRSEGEDCAECGYAVFAAPSAPLVRFGVAFPDAASCCPECCAPSTLASGPCPDCGVALEPAEKDAPVCPEGLHMLVKGEAPGWVCPGCRAAWL